MFNYYCPDEVLDLIGESLFTLFASLTYAYHYLMTLIKLEIVITRAAPAFYKLFMVMGCVFDINTVHIRPLKN